MLGALRDRLRALVPTRGADARDDGDARAAGDAEDSDADDSEVDGSGEPYLDPAYNGRYTAERELRRLANAEREVEDDPADR